MTVTATRRLAALYFADIVGYTSLSARDEPAALGQVEILQAVAGREVEGHGGRIVKYAGDAVLAEFPSVEGAVQSALALAAGFRDDAAAAGSPSTLRVGIHLAELAVAPDGDIYGDGVNIAARLQSEAAAPGQVVASEDVWRQLRRRPALRFEPLGEHELRGLVEPVHVYQVGLRLEAPPAAASPDSPGGGRHRLVVLPFRVLRPDPETDFLGFALSDAITRSLTGIRSLVVRSPLAAGGAPDEDLKAIARSADVDLILTGSIVRAGDRLQVSAQLANARHGALLWTGSEQAPVRDLFGLQDELANRIVDAVRIPLSAREQQQLKRDVPSSPRAFELYLRANQKAYEGLDWRAARDLYREALDHDPLYAPAWANLGRVYRLLWKYDGDADDAEGNVSRAEEAFQRAVEINPKLGLAHQQYAHLEVERGRAPDAMARLLDQARDAQMDPAPLVGLVHALRYCGLLEASVRAHERAVELDPSVRTSVAFTYMLVGDWDMALRAAPTGAGADMVGEIALLALDRTADARAALVDTRQEWEQTVYRSFYETALAVLERDPARALQAGRLAARRFPDPEGLFHIARFWSHLDLREDALELLERVVAMGYGCAPALQRDPWLQPLRSSPKLPTLAQRAEAATRLARERFDQEGGPAILA